MSKWLREPLIHFLLLGGLIFLGYQQFSGSGPGENAIFISRGQQDNLINTFSRTWQRPPSPEEFKGLLDDFVRQEIAYREGLAMGLDEDDIIIRRRMRQKLELLIEDMAALTPPSEEELQTFFTENMDDYRLEPSFNLRQVYFSTDRRGDSARGDIDTALQQLLADPGLSGWEQMGDAIPLPLELTDTRTSEISRMFGAQFAQGIENAEPGAWSGPIESGFGLHLVYVENVADARMPSLDEVHDEVQRDWFSERRSEAVDALYTRLAENYRIEIEPPAQAAGRPAGEPTGRPGADAEAADSP